MDITIPQNGTFNVGQKVEFGADELVIREIIWIVHQLGDESTLLEGPLYELENGVRVLGHHIKQIETPIRWGGTER